jgi:hypothetical protein
MDQTFIETFDNSDGTYLVKYRITKAGIYNLNVQTNSDTVNIKGGPILVVPNLADAASSLITFTNINSLDSMYSV